MIGYALRRLGHALLVVWATFTATFWLLYILPGDPALRVLALTSDNAAIDPEQLAAVRQALGLDRPPLLRYIEQLGAFATGDFGRSIVSGNPVAESILSALPHTLALAGLGLLIGLVAGVLLACAIAFTGSSVLRGALKAVPAVLSSIPGFWLGLMLLVVFSFTLRWLPAFGQDGFASLILPAVTLAAPTAAVIAQVLGDALQRTAQEPHVTTARAKGLSRRRIRLVEILRNALPGSFTIVGLMLGGLVAGSVVAESVFSRQGIGQLISTGVLNRDLPVIQGVVVLTAASYALANLLVDLVQPLLDPRIASAPPRRARRLAEKAA